MPELLIDYDPIRLIAVFRSQGSASNSPWYAQIRRALDEQARQVTEFPLGTLSIDWHSFTKIRNNIGSILQSIGVSYEISESALLLLRRGAEHKNIFENAASISKPSVDQLIAKLTALNWRRDLTLEQTRNLQRLVPLPAGAMFTVSGGGKTAEALAYFFLKAESSQRLLVVAPANAFSSWDEQLAYCMAENAGGFTRLCGSEDATSAALAKQPRLMLITYQQLELAFAIIAKTLWQCETFVFLDASHKIAFKRANLQSEALLRMSHLPFGKLILSGTPMPRSAKDLVPQFEFIYPMVKVTAKDVIDKIQPVFVRTTKAELKLPEVDRKTISVPFNPSQKRLYDLMRSEVARQAEQALSDGSRSALRKLGRSVMRLLEVVSNPSLLANDITFLHDDLLGEVLAEGAAPKVQFACERARRLAKRGLKSIIWTTFRQNVESICEQLRDLGAVYIHGGIDAGQEDDDGTREGRIWQFRNDPNCFVMVANPAAAAEGISLHKVCHHAIYVDRTYNAAHYLQSEDRIHRLGLLPNESPTVEILQCPGSIDENVHARLALKVAAMANALNDESLSIGARQYVPFDIDDDPENESELVDEDDVRSILQWLRNEA